MKTRLILGPLLIALVAGLFWMDWWLAAEHAGRPWGFIVLAASAGLIAVNEVAGLLKRAGLDVDRVTVLLGAVALFASVAGMPGGFEFSHWPNLRPSALSEAAFAVAASTCFVLVLVCIRNVWNKEVTRFPHIAAGTVFAFVYAAVPAALLMAIRSVPGVVRPIGITDDTTYLPDTETVALPHLGLWLIITVIACTRLGADTCAYFAGKAVGKHKLIPHVSPGKTIEGLVGGLVGSVAVAWGCHAVMPGLAAVFSLPEALIFGAAVGLVAPVGDLAESALKRAAGVKDSGRLLPEFGGVLDVIDGLLLTGPLLYLVLLWRLG